MSQEDVQREPPSKEALRRYPNSYGYNYEVNPQGEPCRCTPACPSRCWGACGCKACEEQFAVFCDVAGFSYRTEEWSEQHLRDAIDAYGMGAGRAPPTP